MRRNPSLDGPEPYPITTSAAGVSPARLTPLNHLSFGVMDVDAAYARALAAGATPFDVPVPGEHWDGAPLDVIMSGDRPEPMRMAFMQGPSGELIELYQAAAVSSVPAETAV